MHAGRGVWGWKSGDKFSLFHSLNSAVRYCNFLLQQIYMYTIVKNCTMLYYNVQSLIPVSVSSALLLISCNSFSSSCDCILVCLAVNKRSLFVG